MSNRPFEVSRPVRGHPSVSEPDFSKLFLCFKASEHPFDTVTAFLIHGD